MSKDAAHTRWWQTFEVIFGMAMLVAVALHFAVPRSFPSRFPPSVIITIGASFFFVGLMIVVITRRAFAHQGQHTDPGHPTRQLITTGMFAISRNPLYLGGVCMLVGVALVVDMPWMLVLLLPALVACHYVLILPEERYLTTTFGDEYRRYALSVHRWIGRVRHPQNAR